MYLPGSCRKHGIREPKKLRSTFVIVSDSVGSVGRECHTHTSVVESIADSIHAQCFYPSGIDFADSSIWTIGRPWRCEKCRFLGE
jgi:hypothetical protein